MSKDANVSAATGGSSKGATPPRDAVSASVKKDSTNELPMYDLQEAINFVSTIHEKALENAPMPDVATNTGYKHPSSTPFYRRCVATRLFGLMAKTGAELTARARDYLKPDGDKVRAASLRDAIMGIQLYAEEVNKHLGKRINTQFVANSFNRSLPLTEDCALECAKIFESSLKFGGFISSDGIVNLPDGSAASTEVTPKSKGEEGTELETPEGMQTHTLYLDKTKTKKFMISAPLDLNATEIKRIQKWLEVTLLVEWNEPNETT